MSAMQQELQAIISRDQNSHDMIQAARLEILETLTHRILENRERQRRSAGQRAVIERETVRV